MHQVVSRSDRRLIADGSRADAQVSASGGHFQGGMRWFESVGLRDDGRFADGVRRIGGYGKP